MADPSLRRPYPFVLLRYWLSGYFLIWLFLALVIFIVQTVLAAMLHDREDLRAFLHILDRAPKIFKAFIGGNELMEGNIKGIVAIGYQHPIVLIMLMVNAGTTPTGLLTAELERGTMELLLARPITRGRIYALATLIPMVGQIALVGVIFGSTVLWTNIFDYGEPVPLMPFFLVSVNVAVISCAVVAISVLASAFFNERNRAIGSVVAYLVVSYLLDFCAVWWERLKVIHPWTIYYYCIPNRVLRENHLRATDLSILSVILVVCLVLGYFIWRRKDLAAA